MDVYDLNNNDGGGGTPLKYNPNMNDDIKVPRQERNMTRDSGYDGQRNVIEQKNNEANHQGTGPMMSSMSFSTPIEELDYSGGMEGDTMAPVDNGGGVFPAQQQRRQRDRKHSPADEYSSEEESDNESAETRSKSRSGRGYPLGLTREQYEAVILVVIVSLVFYPDVQAKLAKNIPQFMNADGSRSLSGLFVSGLLVAMLVWVARRFILTAR